MLSPGWVVQTSSSYQIPVGFQGMSYDWFVGLDFSHGVRVYNPALMRWQQVDPSGLSAGDNYYEMDNNGPTYTVDPSGLDGFSTDPETGGLYYTQTHWFKKNQTIFLGYLIEIRGRTYVQFGEYRVPYYKLQKELESNWEEWWNNYPEQLLQWFRENNELDVISTVAGGWKEEFGDDLEDTVNECQRMAVSAYRDTYIHGPVLAVGAAKPNSVYRSVNAAGEVKYVGITNNLARRAAEHLRTKGIQIEKLMGNLSRSDALAVEQALIEIHGLGRNGGSLLNKINSIAKTNLTYADQLRRGLELLRSIGYGG